MIPILGWYNHDNIGDESYKLSFPLIFNEEFQFIEKLSYPVNTCVLGGGDVIGGYFLEQIKNATKKLALSTCLTKNVTKEVLDLFDTIIVRDKSSVEIAKKYEKEAFLYPDFSFALSPNKENGEKLLAKLFHDTKRDKYTKTIAIVINSYLIPNYDTPSYKCMEFDNFCFELTKCIDNLNYSFVFIPFGTSLPTDDTISNGIVATKCKYWKKNLFIKNTLSVQETLDIISACYMTISTRYHSTLFSCNAEIPFIDIIHNHKNSQFLKDINYDKTITLENFSQNQFFNIIKDVEQNYSEIKQQLNIINKEYKNKLKDLKNYVHFL